MGVSPGFSLNVNCSAPEKRDNLHCVKMFRYTVLYVLACAITNIIYLICFYHLDKLPHFPRYLTA